MIQNSGMIGSTLESDPLVKQCPNKAWLKPIGNGGGIEVEGVLCNSMILKRATCQELLQPSVDVKHLAAKLPHRGAGSPSEIYGESYGPQIAGSMNLQNIPTP